HINMLEEQDIQQIGKIVEEKIDKTLEVKLGVEINKAMEETVMPRIAVEVGKAVEEKLDKAIEDKIMPRIGVEMGRVIEENLMPVLGELRDDVDSLKSDVNGLRSDVDGLKDEVGKIRNEMVTKSYLDDKLADLEGGLVSKLRKEDGKVDHLIGLLKNKSILSVQETEQLKEYQIFPRFN
ncbi:MAG: hypothetical protein V1692_00335, partial [bacterium]